MPFHIQIGRITEPDKEISNIFNSLDVPTDSIENVTKALDLLGIEAYAIYDKHDRRRIATSEKLRQHEEKEYMAKEEHNKKMLKLLEEFKALPNVLQSWVFELRIIQLEKRGYPNYDPRISSKMRAYLSLHQYEKREQGLREIGAGFNADLYISAGRILHKKFIKDHPSLTIQESETIVTKIPEMLEAQRHIARKYNIG